jgi:hypothetical protein
VDDASIWADVGIHLTSNVTKMAARQLMIETYRVGDGHPTNEGPVRIQYKCLVPIYVFPEMKLSSLLISKTEL